MAQALYDVLEEIKSLEPLPQVAMRVLELSNHEDVVPGDIVAVIQTDAAITAKVLKLCNSAYYGFQREIATLTEAGVLIGVTPLANLVLTSCAGRYFRDYGHGDPHAAERLWESSVATALAASRIARGRAAAGQARAYTAGLLQNFGYLVVDRFVPNARARLLDEIHAGASPLEAEERVVGMGHAEIGARLAERWQFPEILVDTIRYHHAPERAQVDPRLASCAHLGEMLARTMIPEEDELPYRLEPGALQECGIRAGELEELAQELRREVERVKAMVAVG